MSYDLPYKLEILTTDELRQILWKMGIIGVYDKEEMIEILLQKDKCIEDENQHGMTL